MNISPRGPAAPHRARLWALYPALFALVAIAIACSGGDQTASPAPVAEGVILVDEGLTLVAMWGSVGSGDGEFDGPFGIAVDASGNVYVAEYMSSRVQVFSPEGRFLRKWGSEGTADGQFNSPTGIAVDASGNVYTVEYFGGRVQVFSP